ncbi:MAG: MFS transporter [Chloroflexi bacterium]|nr:MFS transporter [Chloroflexota bacterium]|tara:strand:- start:4228 stop:5448 length:1221 start_codon:yes stop_codon:yes gene_type:complete
MSQENFIPNKTALITLIAACLVVIVSLGIRQTFGLFFFDFEIDLGCTQTEFGFAMGIQLFFWGLLGPVFGIITDKFSGRVAVFIGFLFYLAGIYFLNYGPNTGIWFTFDLGVLIGIGLAATAISIPVSIVSKHFPLNTRTIAIGIVTAAGSFGYFVSPMYTRYTLLEFGWNTTLVIFGMMILVGLIISLFLSTPMEETKQNFESRQTATEAVKEAFSNKSFNYLTLGFFVCGWHIALVATHIPMHIRDKGLEDWTATAILALIGLFNVFGTLTSGYLSTKISKKKLLSAIYFLRGISIIYFIYMPPSVINALIFGATFGYLWLSTVPPTSGIVGHIFGTKYVSLLYGFVFLSHQVGSFLGAYLGGLFHDIYGSLDYAWYISIALSLFAALIHLPIKEKAIERTQTA